MFKELGNMASMLRQAQQMSGKMQEVAVQLKTKRVTGSAGGGMIKVEANGAGEVLKVKIDPTLSGDLEMIEDLLPAALNQVAAKAKELHVEMMQSVAGDMNFPGLDEAISKITGGGG
ncbi:MAG: YbaB/EbfC family nucleoid-associated protein [Planctomycetaceae bacterium]|nr:YbaB/EbfC family nucleoid-associated protein [Planctomycetales bacterium]MCB9923295.1 YbaB/EbfC family nucleoid-associated protein [Planctomycetaceae bacterium]